MFLAHNHGWPKNTIVEHKLSGYWTEQTFSSTLENLANRFGEKIAIIDKNDSISYSELRDKAKTLAQNLLALGLRRFDRVIFQLLNGKDFIITSFAMSYAGIIPIYALPAHRITEISAFAAASQARAYIGPGDTPGFDYCHLARDLQKQNNDIRFVLMAGQMQDFISLDELYQPHNNQLVTLVPSDPEQVYALLLSGGSTGTPKLIPRIQSDYLYNIRTSVSLCQFEENTIYLAALPLAHNFTMSCPGFFGTLFSGGRVITTQDPTPENCFELIERYEVTNTALVPPLAILWLEAVSVYGSSRLRSLKCVQVGGAKLVEEVARKIKPAFRCQLQQVFGMAEGLICYTDLDASDDIVAQTQGKPMSPGDELRIVDENDQEVPEGSVGALLTRGPYTIRSYFNLASHNKTAFTEDGFYRTGDLVRRLPNGYLCVEGRDKDQINRGGEKISPEEVENCLLSHPKVVDAAIVSIPDELWGEKTCAFVIVRAEKPKARELISHLQDKGLADFKIPDCFKFVTTFPFTGVGKTNRRSLREALQKQILQDLNS